ncbi:oligosaccharide flippase family protein [Streptomyces jeddahensis]|uniref:Teichuronic acid biosynthesis protein TuaB n=1 Tax=Streptomyces jeddahensis TaxID=1716141 RepID=A0A177HG98_9ACTN|nr:oligosaccharide flippase family protein [Streptomyces jeddahensis]OAH09610.1 teichuronic acid biosynthesis protein TuaB [Streptomyces jeddahensis]
MTPLTALTVRGMRWTYLGTAAGLAVQLPYTVAMARLLSPADFGLMAMAGLTLRLVDHFARCGLSTAVVQRPALTQRDVRAVFTLAMATGTGGVTVLWCIAPYVTRLLQASPELTSLSRVLGLSLLTTALGAVANGLLRRGMRYRTVALVDFVSYAAGYCGIGLTSALLGSGAWSLAHAALGQSLSAALLSYLLVRHPVKPLFDLRAMRGVAGFGATVSVNGFLEFLTANFGGFVIGRCAGATAAGLHNRAAYLTALPLEQLSGAASKVLFPAFSRIQGQSGRLGAVYADCTALTTLLFLTLSAVIAASGDQLVAVLLGGQWQGSAELVPVLALASALSLVVHFPAVLVEAMGAVGGKAVIQLVQLAVLVAGTAIALFLGCGVYGLVVVVLVGRLTEHALYCCWLNRLFPAARRAVARAYAEAAAVAAVVWGAVWTIGRSLEGACPPTATLTAQLTAAGVLMLCCLRYGTGLCAVRVARERGLLPTVFRRKEHQFGRKEHEFGRKAQENA